MKKPPAQKFLDEKHSAIRNLIIDTDDVYARAWRRSIRRGNQACRSRSCSRQTARRFTASEGEADILALRRKILGNLPDAGMFAGNTDYWRK